MLSNPVGTTAVAHVSGPKTGRDHRFESAGQTPLVRAFVPQPPGDSGAGCNTYRSTAVSIAESTRNIVRR